MSLRIDVTTVSRLLLRDGAWYEVLPGSLTMDTFEWTDSEGLVIPSVISPGETRHSTPDGQAVLAGERKKGALTLQGQLGYSDIENYNQSESIFALFVSFEPKVTDPQVMSLNRRSPSSDAPIRVRAEQRRWDPLDGEGIYACPLRPAALHSGASSHGSVRCSSDRAVERTYA